MDSLFDKITPVIAQLANEKGLRVVRECHDSSSFGNAVIEVASDDFDLRIIRDRGDVTLEISPAGKAVWYNLANVLDFVVKCPMSTDPTVLAQVLSANFEKVTVLMTSDLSETGFLAFEKQRSTEFLKKLLST